MWSCRRSHGQWYPSKPGWQLLGVNQKPVIVFGNKSSKCSTVQNGREFPIVRNPSYLLQVLAKQKKGSQPAQVIFSLGSPLKVVSKY